MKVRSRVTKANLIEGKIYTVESIFNVYKKRNSYNVQLVGINQSFPLKHFRKLNGDKINPQHDRAFLDNPFRKLKVGDFLRSVSKKITTLEYGKIYEIESVLYTVYSPTVSFKKDISKYYSLTKENFEIIDKVAMRDQRVDAVLNDTEIESLQYDGKPYFDNYEKEYEIISLIQKAIIYKRKTKVDASLKEVIDHFCSQHKLVTKEDVVNLNYNKLLNESNSY